MSYIGIIYRQLKNAPLFAFALSLWCLLLPLYTLNNIKFILLALFPVICFGLALLRRDLLKVQLITSDIAWLVFISLGFVSYFWAIDGSLIWSYAFGWLSLIFWMVIFRSLKLMGHHLNLVNNLLSSLFLLVLFMHLATILLAPNPIKIWHVIFGDNPNYTSCYLVMFFPFLLFSKFEKSYLNYLKPICALLLVLILIYTTSRGALGALFLIGFFYIWINYPLKYFWLSLAASIVVLGILSFSSLSIVSEFEADELSRKYMIESSLKVLWENLFIGSGLGNWHLEAYKYDVSDYPPFNTQDKFVRFRCHNFYAKILAELGVIGMLAFLFPIGKTLWVRLKNLNKATHPIYLAGISSLLVYLVISYFYSSPNFFPYHFSGINLLAFCMLGLLTHSYSKSFKLTRFPVAWVLILSICSMIWFLYSTRTWHQFAAIKNKMSLSNTEESISRLKDLYHPVFKSVHDYKTSIPYELARLYQKKGDNDSAGKYYRIAVEKAPFDPHILLSYSRFLFRMQHQIVQAREYLNKIYEIQNDQLDINLLLAEISIFENKFEEAINFLKVERVRSWRPLTFRIVENLLYLSPYLEDVVPLTEEQKKDIVTYANQYRPQAEQQLIALESVEKVNSDAAKKIKSEISASLQKEERNFYQLLTEAQHLACIRDKFKGRVDLQFDDFVFQFSLDDDQQNELRKLFSSYVIQREFFRVREKTPIIRADRKKWDLLRAREAQLEEKWENDLSTIFSESQFREYSRSL